MSETPEFLGEELPEIVAAREMRDQRIRLSVFSSLITKPLAVIIPFVTVPLFLKYLGNSRYGLYESVGALAAWLALTNIGLGLGLINKLTDTHVSGDRELARRYVSTVVFAILAISVIGLVLLSIITPMVNWAKVFPSDDPVGQRETGWAFYVAGAAVFVGFMASLPPVIYAGYQETHLNNIWDGACKLTTLIASLVVVHTPFGLVGVLGAVTLGPALVRLVNTIDLFARQKPWLRPHPRLLDRSLLRVVMIESVSLFILYTAAVGIFQVDKVVIGMVLGAEANTRFGVLGRLYLIVFGVFMLLIAPLWPAHGEAFRRRDFAWIKRTIRLSSLLGCTVIGACGVVMYFCGDYVVRVWTRGQLQTVSKPLVLGLTVTFISRAWIECRTIVLIGAGYLLPQMYFLGANAILNVVLAIVLAKHYGITGVAWSIPISTALTSGWGCPLMVSRCIKARAAEPAPAPVPAPVTVLASVDEMDGA
jgi:O-antigen/teichoic acid export membrane protein